MKLEEVKKVLKGLSGRCKNCENKEYCDGCYIDAEDVEAIETVLQELEHLQKENERYKRNSISKDKIRELISKIDADIETNDRRMIMYKEEMGTSGYVCKMIAYDPRSVKIILQELLKEE